MGVHSPLLRDVVDAEVALLGDVLDGRAIDALRDDHTTDGSAAALTAGAAEAFTHFLLGTGFIGGVVSTGRGQAGCGVAGQWDPTWR
ncbi:hypothetical protein [Streptomyces sp. NPDC048419]|uniref:hypothetical protein n=1 Tax=Streptomyces sp. NPDC048419 TaxID=3365547 RepID=UPI0037121A83